MMVYFVVAALIVLLDQYLKAYMSEILSLCVPGNCNSIEIFDVFQFTLLHNRGAAFSFLNDAGGWQQWLLVGVSSIVSIMVAVWLKRVYASQKILAFGLAFVLGGAIGNLIDRAVDGYVVDFIVVHWREYYFPAFNIADSAIFIGACCLIVDTFLNTEQHVVADPNE